MQSSIIHSVTDKIWTLDGDQVRMFSIPFGTRMTVIRLADGALWLHSPVSPTAERFAAVEALGEVKHIVAPNHLHHLYLSPWSERFPGAKLWADPKLAKKRSDLSFHGMLGEQAPAAWQREIDQLIFGGSKILPETVFLHRESGTLVVTDIVQNHEPAANSWFWRQVKRLDGILAPNGGAPRDWRLSVRDRSVARAARDRMLSWDFDRLLMTHGRCLDEGAHAFVERAFAWLDK